ncbi:MAG: general secretion pathway protein GspK [Verrucomicrobia bacterium]|jgi:general secretion pathway protein K|nr:general secretion pathway protein GspK [Verrucomicrobiota bacterium]
MRIRRPSASAGIALIIVMITILVLSVLAGGFAYSMKVETKLARNANSETELQWMGRSGVELARFVLAQQLALGCEPYDSLNQIWAGGPGGQCTSNSPLTGIGLTDVELGNGRFSVKITDLERKFNINVADEAVLQRAFMLMDADAGEFPAVIAAILDWVDPDDNTHIGGAESDYYQTLIPPYYAKNRPIDDLSELLLVRGVTPDLYFGPASTNHTPGRFERQNQRLGRVGTPLGYPVGLMDLFTPVSSGKININTASLMVLQMVPFIDENRAAQIITLRSGYDGQEGTDDDTPAGSQGMNVLAFLASAGLSQQEAAVAARYFDQRSRTFEVTVEAEVNSYKRTFIAIVGRNSPRDVPVLSFYWR